MYILFRAEGQELKRIDSETVASDSKGFLHAKFEIDDEWNELALEAVFEQNGKKYVQVLDDNTCLVPIDVLNAGRFKVWLVGVDSDNVIRATTESVTIEVKRGPGYDAENAVEPTATEVEQILSAANEAKRIANSVRKDAEDGKFDGADGKSAYEIAKENGFDGTEEEWLASLGGVSEDKVNDIIAKYLEDNEITGEVDSAEVQRIVAEYLVANPPEAGVDEDTVNQLITDYLKTHKPTIVETDPTVPSWAKQPNKPTYTAEEVGARPADWMPTAKDVGAVTDEDVKSRINTHNSSDIAHTGIRNRLKTVEENKAEKDDIPTTLPASDVYSWAKQPSKPTYSASEVGALPASTVIPTVPTNVSAFINDAGYVKTSELPDLKDLGGITSGEASGLVSMHNTATSAHNDIRLLITEVTNRLNAALDSDDVNLDQLSEIVAYIKTNKTLIEAVTTNKVSVADIVNNLTTNVTNKPLSAAQGVALKALIDAIIVPTKLSDLSGDTTHRTVTDAEKTVWNAKSDFSGKYADLDGRPTIPTVPTKVSAFENDKGYVNADEVNAILEEKEHENDIRYITPSFTQGAYMGTNGTAVSQSSNVYAYTEKIAVTKGDIVELIVTSTSTGSKDKNLNFTAVTAFVDGKAVSSLGVAASGQEIYQYIVPATVTEVVASARFFETAYSNQRIKITPAGYSEEEEAASLTLLRNDYSFSLPKKLYLKNGDTAEIYLRNLTNPNYLVRLGSYSNATTIRATDDVVKITGNAVANKPISYAVYDNHFNSIEEGTMTLSILGTVPASQKMLLIGDSFIATSSGYFGSCLRDLFTADGNTLTLLGTKGTSPKNHEGVSGMKYTILADGYENHDIYGTSPFGGSAGFNFSTYMTTQGYSDLNSVYIQLGTNDASAVNPNQDLSSVISAMKKIISSIQAYSSSIKIYLGLTVMPNLNSAKFAETYNGTGFNWVMKQNMLRLNDLIIKEYGDSSSVKIVANNCILDNTEDILDNVHPTNTGFAKMAKQLYYTMMS